MSNTDGRIPSGAGSARRGNYPTRRVAWSSAIVVFVLTAIAMADRLAISMLIGPIKQEFAIGDFQASLLVGAAFALFYMLFLLPVGWAADRYSRRRVLTICLVIWSLASIACGFATSFFMLFGMRMLVGAGEAGLGPGSHGIIGASFPREQLAKPLALQSIGMQVGGALGIAAAGAVLAAGAAGRFDALPVIGDLAPWRIAFIAIGLPGLLALVLVPLIYDPATDDRRRSDVTDGEDRMLPFLREHPVLVILVILSAGMSAIGFGSVSAWSPEFLMRSYDMPPARAGAAFGSTMLAAAIFSQFAYSVLVDAFAKKGILDAPIRVGLLPVALSIPAAWFAYRASDASGFLAWQFVLLCCVVPCGALANTCVQQVSPPALRSRLSSIMILTISLLGFAIGPSAAGWLSEFVFGEARLGIAVSTVIMTAMTLTLLMLAVVRPRLEQYTAGQGVPVVRHPLNGGPMIEFYDNNMSACAQKVRLVLVAKGLEFQRHQLKPARPATSSIPNT